MLNVEGRKLPVEKILFRKNTVLAGEDADWGRDAVRENVISAVSWMQRLNSVLKSHSHVSVLPYPIPGSTSELDCGDDKA